MDKAHEVLTTFYKKCLTLNSDTNLAQTMGMILADNFVSNGSLDSKTKDQLIAQIGFFWKLIPNLKWEPQEILNDGNKYVVRSIASGTPNGDFMGMSTDGSKSFKIMTIDIHTVENGQILAVHHLEDWVTGMKQLKS